MGQEEQIVQKTDNTAGNNQEDEVIRKKIELCTAEINAVLKKYECNLDASIFLRAGQVIPGIRVILLDKTDAQQPI